MFDWTARLLDEDRRICDYEQGTEPSFDHLLCGDALFHAVELSRLRNARRNGPELSGFTRLHSIARGSGAQILLRDPNWNVGDGTIRCAVVAVV